MHSYNTPPTGTCRYNLLTPSAPLSTVNIVHVGGHPSIIHRFIHVHSGCAERFTFISSGAKFEINFSQNPSQSAGPWMTINKLIFLVEFIVDGIYRCNQVSKNKLIQRSRFVLNLSNFLFLLAAYQLANVIS